MYCDTEEEILKNPEALPLMEEIANGDSDAFDWMKSFWSFTHFIDDCVDKDRIATSDEASLALADFVDSLVCNKFFLKNKSFLYPLIISACCRWRVGDSLEKGDHDDQIRSQVVRCGDIDIYLGVAFLVGGFSHMAKCADKCRTYDIN